MKVCDSMMGISCISYPLKDPLELSDTWDYIKGNYSEAAIFSIINKNVEYLLELIDDDDKSEDYPVTMLDIMCAFVTFSKNPKIYKNHYFISSFTYKIESDKNNLFNTLLSAKYGEPKYISNSASLNIYAVLMLLKESIKITYSAEADILKDELYRTRIDLPDGTLSINSKNVALVNIYLFQCNNNSDYSIIIYPPGYYDTFVLSNSMDVTSIQYNYDFSISDEKVPVNVYPIGLYINDEDDSIYYLLTSYVELMNANDGCNGKFYVYI